MYFEQEAGKVEALTCRIFDQDVQLLVHSDLKRPVFGVLGLIGCHAAVRLGDKRVGDVSHGTARTTVPVLFVPQIIRHHDHDTMFETRNELKTTKTH